MFSRCVDPALERTDSVLPPCRKATQPLHSFTMPNIRRCWLLQLAIMIAYRQRSRQYVCPPLDEVDMYEH
jgi:hypothetical protein